MSELKWRFPSANGGVTRGNSSDNGEVFKKQPITSFVREILQNSIDAGNDDENPVVIEFAPFETDPSRLPGIEELKSQIQRCIDFWRSEPAWQKEYQGMLNVLTGEKIKCLRISDFNTTGLHGVDSHDFKGNSFLALVKGSGISSKQSEVAGGNRGVGKNAAFNLSSIKTIFYETITDDGHKGSIGVADFISGYDPNVDNPANSDYTQGIGYYSKNDLNDPFDGLIAIDGSKYLRAEGRTGTDIFIIGFDEDTGWENEAIISVLDSFSAAIYYKKLAVKIGDTVLSSDTIGNEIKKLFFDAEGRFNQSLKSQGLSIVAQYQLLSQTDGQEVNILPVEVNENFSLEVRAIKYKPSMREMATHRCRMIRVPYMFIKDINIGNDLPVSALCILEESNFTKRLRSIENPQHVDWEPKRIKDKALAKEVKDTIAAMTRKIKEAIGQLMMDGSEVTIDPEGAGEFLPDEADETGNSENESSKEMKRLSQETYVSKPRRNEIPNDRPVAEDADGNSLIPDVGGIDETTAGDIRYPNDHNGGEGGDNHPGPDQGTKVDGDETIFRQVKMRGIRCMSFALNKSEGRYRYVFYAPECHEKCYFKLNMVGDDNSSEIVRIIEAAKNGQAIALSKENECGPFSIELNEKIVLDLKTDRTEYFASEVEVSYAD